MYLYVKLNWDAIFFFPVEIKDCMNSALYKYRKKSALLLINVDVICLRNKEWQAALYCLVIHIKAYMNRYKLYNTAAIFF